MHTAIKHALYFLHTLKCSILFTSRQVQELKKIPDFLHDSGLLSGSCQALYHVNLLLAVRCAVGMENFVEPERGF